MIWHLLRFYYHITIKTIYRKIEVKNPERLREMEGKARQDKVDAALAGFQPVLFQGERLSKEQLIERKNAYADHQGVPRDSIDFAPVGNNQERADFHRHRAWEKHNKNGFDTKTLREYQREQSERSSSG